PGVILASPVSQPPSLAQASASSGPAARWIAPQTPPPGASAEFAALTMASTSSVVMSPSTISIRLVIDRIGSAYGVNIKPGRLAPPRAPPALQNGPCKAGRLRRALMLCYIIAMNAAHHHSHPKL